MPFARYTTRSFAVFALLSLLWLVACRRHPDFVAVIPRTTATLLWEPMHLGVVETASHLGLRADWNGPADEADNERQLNLVSTALKTEPCGIIFAPSESLAARSVVLQVVNHHVPIVIVDDELGPPAGPYLSYVSTDEIAGTHLAAQRVAQVLGGHGSVALLGISPRSEGGLSREQEFEQALTTIAPGIRIKVRRFGDAVVTHQQQIAQEVLRSTDPVDAVVTLTATATRGAYYAKIAAEPHPNTVIIGFDQDMLLPIETGEVDSVVVQDTRRIGQLALQNINAQRNGRAVPGRTLVPPFLLTRESLQAPAMQQLLAYTAYNWSAP